MAAKKDRPIKVGDRFETLDGRDAGRVVEVTEVRGLSASAKAHLANVDTSTESGAAHAARVVARRTFFTVQTESHPKNPDAVGNVSRVSENTLRTKYRRVSR